MADRDEIDWIKEHEPWRIPKEAYSVVSVKQLDEIIEEDATVGENWFMSLTKLNGIGNEIAKDIGRAFPSQDALIGALKDDTAPFRNDIVRKLNKHFQLN